MDSWWVRSGGQRVEEALCKMEEREEHLSTIERAEEALWAGEVALEDMTVGVGECGAVGESVMGGKTFTSPVTGAEGAKGSVASHGMEVVRVVGVEAVASDGLEGCGLKVVGLSIKAATSKRGEGRG